MKTPQQITDKLQQFQAQILENEMRLLDSLNRNDIDAICGIVPLNAYLHGKIELLEWCLKD